MSTVSWKSCSAFPPEYGEAWNRRQVSDALLLAGTHHELIASDGSDRPEAGKDTGGLLLVEASSKRNYCFSPLHLRTGEKGWDTSCSKGSSKARGSATRNASFSRCGETIPQAFFMQHTAFNR
jgi:hypothetical protein